MPAVAADDAPERGEAPLPIDEHVVHGVFDNGLRYLIRENHRPESRAELRLVVTAGSVDEDDDQRGLAHFVEHMVFNGTEGFAGNEIIEYLESIGARFGADLNAYTSFDETVYSMEVPTDREGLLDDGIRILAEFAARATFDEEEIRKERGVVLDEWRGGLGAGTRIRDQQLPVVLHGSRYAERLPIGLPEVIERADRGAMLRFYEDWYRPERMAVIVVGDFDASDVESAIRAEFATLSITGPPRERTYWPVPPHADTLLAFADDPELRRTTASVIWKRSDPPIRTGSLDEYQEDLVRRMTIAMFQQRLFERTQAESPPFLGAYLSVNRMGRSIEITSLTAGVVAGGEALGLTALLEERERAWQHGFLDSELDRTRRDMLAGIEATYAERDKAPSSAYAAECVRHILEDEPIPGIEYEVELWREFLPTVSVVACDEMFRSLFPTDGVVIEVSRNSSAEGVTPEKALEVLRGGADLEPATYVDHVVGERILDTPAAPGSLVSRREHADVGVSELVLSNGMHVFVKATDFQDDDVRFLSVARGGTSVVDDGDLASAEITIALAQESGWGGHSAVDLGRLLTGKVATASPYVSDRRHGISGSSTAADLPTALELVVLEMGAPNRDPAAFARLSQRLRARLENRESDPGAKYQDRLVAINTNDHPRTRPMTLARVDEIDPETALACYRDWFSNPADFGFFLVGNVDVDSSIPMLTQTLGSIPASSAQPSDWVDRGIRFAKNSVRETVRAGSEPKSSTTITIASYGGEDPREWHRLRSAASILERRLRERLREALGATYGVSAWYDHDILGRDDGTIGVRFGCDPQDAERLGREVFDAIDALGRDGPTEAEVAKEREIQTRELETALRQNGFWIGSLANLWIRGRDFDEMSSRQTRIDELNRDELHRVFRQSFGPEPRTWVDLQPAAVAEPVAP